MIDLDRRYLWAGAVLVLLLVFAGGMKYSNQRNQEQAEKQIIAQANTQQNDSKESEEIIQVYVIGAVEKPGVYRLPLDARVHEAIEMAKALPSANLNNINLAMKIEDGEAIMVPAWGEEDKNGASGSVMTGLAGSSSAKTNINRASVQDLDGKLPGIGPTLAQRIVDYRTSHGSFDKIEDLKEVSGIGDKKYDDIKDLITVR